MLGVCFISLYLHPSRAGPLLAAPSIWTVQGWEFSLYHHSNKILGLNPTQIYEGPCRAVIEPVQPLVVHNSFLPNSKKFWFLVEHSFQVVISIAKKKKNCKLSFFYILQNVIVFWNSKLYLYLRIYHT